MRQGRLLISLLIWVALTGLAFGGEQPSPDSRSATAPPGGLSPKDYRFVQRAYGAGLEESALGELARQKGVSQAVRDFGERLADEQGKANNELKQILSEKRASVPTNMSRSSAVAVRRLKYISGPSFDKTYAREMLKTHADNIRDFQAAAKELSDPDLIAWAVKTLAVLQRHQRLAQELEASLRSSRAE